MYQKILNHNRNNPDTMAEIPTKGQFKKAALNKLWGKIHKTSRRHHYRHL